MSSPLYVKNLSCCPFLKKEETIYINIYQMIQIELHNQTPLPYSCKYKFYMRNLCQKNVAISSTFVRNRH